MKLRPSLLPATLAVMAALLPPACGGAGQTSKTNTSSDVRNSTSVAYTAALSKTRTLLDSASRAVKGGDKAAAIDAAASLTEVAYQIGDPAPPK